LPKTPSRPETGYQLTRQVPSVFLEKETVALIEAFLLERGSQVDPPRARRNALFLSIIDSSGAARLASIRDYPFRTFDEGIQSLFVGYGIFGEALSISVNFSRTAAESHVSVNYRGAGAGKVAEGLAEGIIGMLKDVKTSNALYHPGPALRGALTALFLVGIGIQFGFFILYARIFPFLLPLILVLYSYLYLAPMFNPYTTFDTPRTRESRHWKTWLVGAGMTLLLLWLVSSLGASFLP
jgi:hypothetical protein